MIAYKDLSRDEERNADFLVPQILARGVRVLLYNVFTLLYLYMYLYLYLYLDLPGFVYVPAYPHTFQGQCDLICNFLGTEWWSNAMEWPGRSAFLNARDQPFVVNGNEVSTSFPRLLFSLPLPSSRIFTCLCLCLCLSS